MMYIDYRYQIEIVFGFLANRCLQVSLTSVFVDNNLSLITSTFGIMNKTAFILKDLWLRVIIRQSLETILL